MKANTYSAIFCLLMIVFATVGVTGAAKVIEVEAEKPAAADAAAAEEVKFEDIPLPEKGSPEYWTVRSDAMGELTPLLTKKRAEMKQKRQILADYLLKIGKGEAMAAANVQVTESPEEYAKALGVYDEYKQRGIAFPDKLPSWEETAEFAMRFIIDEGYIPVHFDGQEDINSFIDLCKRKEKYAEKVRKEMREYVKDCLKIWTYLGTINEQAGCREWVAQMKVDSMKSKNAERAMLAEERRMAALDRRESEKDRKYQDAQDRASFRSSRRERGYQSRNDRLQYQQTLLNERYTNHYRW